MPVQTISEFLDGLTSSRLLEPSQIDELLRRPEPSSGDLSGVGRFLQDRGWLTRFQVQEIRAGRSTGLMFGGYRILEKLEDTVAGPAFKAFHPALQRPVTLRWIRPEWLQPADSIPDYLRRAQGASLVSSPNLINVLDAGVMDGVLFVVEEFVDGTDLKFFVKEMGALPVPLACEYIRQAAIGLEAAHSKGVFHGDLNPTCLILAPVMQVPSQSRPGQFSVRPGPGAWVRVEGVGLTPNRPPLGEMSLGQSANIGAIDYLAPERVNRAGFDARSDIYSLGAALYFLLGTRPPFAANAPHEALYLLANAEPTPIELLRNDLRPGLSEIVRRMLSKDPGQRPASANEVAAALLPFGLGSDGPPALPPAVPLASETATQGNPLPAIVAEHNTAVEFPAAVAQPMMPKFEELQDHHSANGDSPFGGPSYASSSAEPEEHHDPFGGHPDDIPLDSGAARRPKPPEASHGRTWLVVGLLLHLTAVALLIAWLTGAFKKSESPSPPPSKKRSDAGRFEFGQAPAVPDKHIS